jgi:hypothetical protein
MWLWSMQGPGSISKGHVHTIRGAVHTPYTNITHTHIQDCRTKHTSSTCMHMAPTLAPLRLTRPYPLPPSLSPPSSPHVDDAILQAVSVPAARTCTWSQVGSANPNPCVSDYGPTCTLPPSLLPPSAPVYDSLLLAHERCQGLLQVKVHVKGPVEAARPTGAHTILLNSLTATRLRFGSKSSILMHVAASSATTSIPA